MANLTPEQEYTSALSARLVDEPWRESFPGVTSRAKTLTLPEIGFVTLRQAYIGNDLDNWENSVEIYDPDKSAANGVIVWRRDDVGTDLRSAAIFLGTDNASG